MVEKWYLEFRGVLCSVKLMLIVGLNYPILKQINLLGSAKNHKIDMIWDEVWGQKRPPVHVSPFAACHSFSRHTRRL